MEDPAIVTANCVEPPDPTVADVGFVDTVTLEDGAVIVRLSATVDVSEPDVPFALIVYVPAVTLDWLESVRRVVPEPVTLVGE